MIILKPNLFNLIHVGLDLNSYTLMSKPHTKIISDEPPTPEEVKLTEDLLKVLHEYNLFESAEESEKRQEVLGKLNQYIRQWIREVCISQVANDQIYCMKKKNKKKYFFNKRECQNI